MNYLKKYNENIKDKNKITRIVLTEDEYEDSEDELIEWMKTVEITKWIHDFEKKEFEIYYKEKYDDNVGYDIDKIKKGILRG